MKIEPYVHSIVLLFSFGTAFGLLPLGIYNHIGTVCWTIGQPQGCGDSTYKSNPDVPCERGNWAWIYGVVLFYGPIWVCVVFTTVAMTAIYLQVRTTDKRNQKYAGRTHSKVGKIRMDPKLVATQAMLYTGAFIITWLPSTIWSVATWFEFASYWLDLASAIAEPLQGFWNFLIFIRRRRDLRRKVIRFFRWVSCMKAISNMGNSLRQLTSSVPDEEEIELDDFGEDIPEGAYAKGDITTSKKLKQREASHAFSVYDEEEKEEERPNDKQAEPRRDSNANTAALSSSGSAQRSKSILGNMNIFPRSKPLPSAEGDKDLERQLKKIEYHKRDSVADLHSQLMQ